MNSYERMLTTIPDNQVVDVKMNDGTIVKCKKVPINTVENMDIFLTGIKDGLNIANGALNFIATCGNMKLYSAVGDVSTYMRSGNGNILSASVGADGKITGQPGFQEAEFAKQGLKAATTMAKVIPWVAIAVTVIEIGTKIVMNQKQIKANQIAYYDKMSEINEDSINDLWQILNDYTLSKQDEAHRTADLVIIKQAFNTANNSFRKLAKEAAHSKKIDDHLVCAMKTALDVYSFAYLLNIMYAKVEDCSDYVEKALEDIREKTKIYDETYEKSCEYYLKKCVKEKKFLDVIQFENKNPSKDDVAKRIGFNIASGGVTEGVSAISKLATKNGTKTEQSIKRLDLCKESQTPFADCIENAGELLLLKKPVLRDEKYLYYQVD